MLKNIHSVVLLSLLFTILMFLVGFRLGKYVEHIDKTYVPPSTPIITLSQTSPMTKPFAVITYTHKVCGVSFLAPNYLEEKAVSSQEAVLFKDKEKIRVSCDKKTAEAAKQEQKMATPSATTTVLNRNQKVLIYENDNLSSAVIYNTSTSRSILIETTDTLVKLVLYSLEFVK